MTRKCIMVKIGETQMKRKLSKKTEIERKYGGNL